ncbi:MAG: Hsp20/alpha crystallin family protein [Kofleriaceae bacterium]|nr:Hsp20/alpha crystallin family protein [Kofleriaceae bacterium]
MQTYAWNPWSIFDQLERSMFAKGPSEWPMFDIEDTEDATILSADLPGMGEDDIEVVVSAPYLVVRGERKGKEGARYVRRARFQGVFERRFWIGDTYDPDHVHAHIANGELTIRLDKPARAKPRRIKLTSGGIAAKVKGLLGVDKDKEAA